MDECSDVWYDEKMMVLRNNESNGTQGSWNLFSFYLHVITRINFTVEFAPNTLVRRDFLLRKLHNCSDFHKWPYPYLFVHDDRTWRCSWCTHGLPKIGSVAVIRTKDGTGSNHLSDIHFCSSYLTRRDSRDVMTTTNSSLQADRGANEAKIAAEEVQESYWRRRLSFLSTLSEKFEPRKFSLLLDSVEYTYVHLTLFFCLVSISTFLVAKQIFYSSLWAEKGLLEESQSLAPLSSPATPFEQETIHSHHQLVTTTNWSQLGSSELVKQMIHYYLLNDMFVKFSNSRIFNLVAMTLLVPSALVRLRQLLQLFGRIIYSSRSSVSQTIRSHHSQPINTVQLNLSYLYSLKTVTHLWLRLVIESWYHKHRYDNLKKDLEQVLRNVPAIDVTTLIALDLKTKLYFYNMIQFDYCYTEYFVSMTSYLSGRILKPDKNDGGANAKTTNKNIFVAKPIHRIDLDHMAWLLLMLLVLYVVGLLSIMVPSLCYMAIELNIQNFGQLTFSSISLGWSGIKADLTWFRLVQMFVWQTLIILAIFDLFNFYSCCIICFSRAAYLRKQLEKISNSCRSLEEISQVKSDACPAADGQRSHKFEDEPVGHYKSLLIATNRCQLHQQKQILNLHLNQHQRLYRPLRRTASPFKSSSSLSTSETMSSNLPSEELSEYWKQIRSINNQLEFILDWVSLVTQELIDVNKFFTSYLILEIIFKVLSLVLVFSALISKRGQLFENCFLVINGNTAFTPIMIVVVMASLIEYEFRGICRQLSRIMVHGRKFLTLKNRRQLVIQANYLSIKNNRSFVLGGYLALTLGSLMSVVGWIATGIVLLRRNQ